MGRFQSSDLKKKLERLTIRQMKESGKLVRVRKNFGFREDLFQGRFCMRLYVRENGMSEGTCRRYSKNKGIFTCIGCKSTMNRQKHHRKSYCYNFTYGVAEIAKYDKENGKLYVNPKHKTNCDAFEIPSQELAGIIYSPLNKPRPKSKNAIQPAYSSANVSIEEPIEPMQPQIIEQPSCSGTSLNNQIAAYSSRQQPIMLAQRPFPTKFSFSPTLDWCQKACKLMNIEFICNIHDSGIIPDQLQYQNVEADGNCGYRTVSYLTSGSEKNHVGIRQAIANFVEKNKIPNLEHQYPEAGANAQKKRQYVTNNMSEKEKESLWFTEEDVAILAVMLDVNIFVWAVFHNDWKCFGPKHFEDPSSYDPSKPSLLINHNEGRDHFSPAYAGGKSNPVPSTQQLPSFSKPSELSLISTCKMIDLEYSRFGYAFWGNHIHVNLIKLHSDRIKIWKHRTEKNLKLNFYQCLAKFLNGKYDSGDKLKANFLTMCDNKFNNDPVVFSDLFHSFDERHLRLFCGFLSCRIGVYENGDLTRYGNWSIPGETLTILIQKDGEAYSPISNL